MTAMISARLRCLALALVCTAGLWVWQALTVRFSYGGNWTALYCTGALFQHAPPALDSENIYLFPNSTGYDGQIYHYMAHDPFFRRGFSSSMNAPRRAGTFSCNFTPPPIAPGSSLPRPFRD